jgi:hypothetical protein
MQHGRFYWGSIDPRQVVRFKCYDVDYAVEHFGFVPESEATLSVITEDGHEVYKAWGHAVWGDIPVLYRYLIRRSGLVRPLNVIRIA